MPLIRFKVYQFNQPSPEGFIRPVTPFKKHPLGFLGYAIGFPLTAIGVALEGSEAEMAFAMPGVAIVSIALLSGSLFSFISYLFYYYKSIKYDRNLEQKIRMNRKSSKTTIQYSDEYILNAIKSLSNLHKEGVITSDEFKAKKEELLSRL